jgi:hypothetical protein
VAQRPYRDNTHQAEDGPQGVRCILVGHGCEEGGRMGHLGDTLKRENERRKRQLGDTLTKSCVF